MANVTPSPVQRALLDQLQTVERDFSYDWDAVRGGLAFARSHDLAPRSPQLTHREEDDGARSARLATRKSTSPTNSWRFAPMRLDRAPASIERGRSLLDEIQVVHRTRPLPLRSAYRATMPIPPPPI